MVVIGWGFSGWPPTLEQPAPVSVALIVPDGTDSFRMGTADYIGDPVTNGAGSAIVADFNEDGRDDIFLAAHNESPFVAMPSTAYLSNEAGGFTKVTLSDQVMAHDAQLVYIDDKPAVLTGNFTPGDANAIYTFVNGSFLQSTPENFGRLWGMSSTLAAFGSDGQLQIARGNVGHTWNAADGWDVSNIDIYAFDGQDVTSLEPIQSIVPYLSTLPQYQDRESLMGVGLTHTYRLWNDDLNHDGHPDLLAGQSMWSVSSKDFPSALQVLINDGTGRFVDATVRLNPDMRLDVNEMDYNPNFVDLDHSGIDTYLFAGSTSWGDPTRQSDYVLLNDGTGRLHVALHDTFSELAPQVYALRGLPFGANSTPPRFLAIPRSDGSLDFVAEVATLEFNKSLGLHQTAYKFVSVPLDYNPTTDFVEDVTVADRNHSMLMRTWAGNDTFRDSNANASARIDGGLGIDQSVYSGPISDYFVERHSDGSVTVNNEALSDTLINIERVAFSDRTLAFDIDGIGGQVYRLYKATYDRVPDAEGLGFWLYYLDRGFDMTSAAESFLNQPEFRAMYDGDPATPGEQEPSDQQFCYLVYKHVLQREPDATGYQVLGGRDDEQGRAVRQGLDSRRSAPPVRRIR